MSILYTYIHTYIHTQPNKPTKRSGVRSSRSCCFYDDKDDFLKPSYALNRIRSFEGISIVSCVVGFLPVVGLDMKLSNFPKPDKRTALPSFTASTIESRIVPTILSDFATVRSCVAATSSIICFLFTIIGLVTKPVVE
jgi:hypothetical protein